MLIELIVQQIRSTPHPITLPEMAATLDISPANILEALADQGNAPCDLPEAYLAQQPTGVPTFRIVRPPSRDGFPQEGGGWGCYGE